MFSVNESSPGVIDGWDAPKRESRFWFLMSVAAQFRAPFIHGGQQEPGIAASVDDFYFAREHAATPSSARNGTARLIGVNSHSLAKTPTAALSLDV